MLVLFIYIASVLRQLINGLSWAQKACKRKINFLSRPSFAKLASVSTILRLWLPVTPAKTTTLVTATSNKATTITTMVVPVCLLLVLH